MSMSNSQLHSDAVHRLEHGRLVITGKSRVTGQHITLRLRTKNRDIKKRNMLLNESKIVGIDAGKVQLRTAVAADGSTHEYVARDLIGWIWSDQILKKGGRPVTANKYADASRFWLAQHIVGWLRGDHDLHADLEVNLEDFCGYCGRQLSHPESKQRGLGPVCFGKKTEGQHAPKGITVEQMELIA